MKPIVAAILAAFPIVTFAAPDAHGSADSETIVVTATREAVRLTDAVADVSVISRTEIEQAGVTTLPELLSREPGIQYYSNGGPGKASGIFIRGAGVAQSLVLVDGLRFGSATAGGASLEQIPLDQIDHIEIVRGPMSALYGSDAIGGVIQVFTRKAGGKPKLDVFAGYGTYGTQSYTAGASGSAGDFRYSVRAGYDDSLGFSATTSLAKQPYSYDPDKDGYRRTSAGTSLGWAIAEGHDLQFDAQYNKGRNHYDAQDFMGNPFDAYDDHETAVYGLTLKDRLLDSWNSTLRIGRTTDDDLDFGSFSPPSGARYRTIQDQATWQNDFKFDVGMLMLGTDWVNQKAEVEDSYDLSRDIASVFAGWSGHYGAHRIQLNARHDDNSQFGGHTTGSAGWSWEFVQDWQVRLGAASAFRAPTFNDLYYPGFSNPDLKSERSHNYDAAIAWDTKSKGASLTAYRNRVTDMIELDSNYVPQNIGNAKLDGATLAGYLKTDAGYDFSAGLDYLDARDLDTGLRLIRRADWQSMASAGYANDTWRAGAQVQWVGARYDDAANTHRMDAYTLVNLYGQYQLTPMVRLEGRIDNLFDQKYETAWGYGTAGASVFAGVRVMTK
jgi:vitamin B12 transporter